ncbi:MAG: sulfite exporter TauE/SafE family protein [Actinomycetota bacterium]|nr:sulfite exporter TauE/SafE family protein [Actinomycetota bacterium]MDA3013079.1 sulfite exporter TauE/SafE family protein [Actinomycetota bacterium]
MSFPFDLGFSQILFLGLLFFLSSAIQGVLGFGFAVISSPIVVQINPELVPQLLSLLALPLAIRVFYREKEKVNLKLVRPLILGRLVGGPIGTLLLLNLSTKYLSLSVGFIVLMGGVASYFGWVIKRNKTNSFLAGTFSGIFGMTAAVGGPPVALLYRNTKSEEFRPSLNSVFSFGIIITLVLLLATGKLSLDHLYLFFIFIPFVLIGFSLSNKLFSKVSDSIISLTVTYFSIFSGLFVILKNII